ncbi:MAG TPA: MarR family winged helix-turn-helix transcriptional regulator [Rudaea sp.]
MKRQPTCVCINLRRAARAISKLYDDALAESGLKITQFSLLREIERSEPAPISRLADAVELDRTTLARNLSPLERDGLVALAAGEDLRVTEVRLTRKGRAAIARAVPMWERAQAQIASRLPAGGLGQLQKIVVEVSEAMVESGQASRRFGQTLREDA